MKDFFVYGSVASIAIFGLLAVMCGIIWGIDIVTFQFTKVQGEHNVVLTAVEKTAFNTVIYAKTEGESSQEDEYCVNNNKMSEELYRSIRQYVQKKQNVLFIFKQEFEIAPWICRDVVEVLPITK